MTTVLIWNNRKLHVQGHTYMGHASMNIDDQWKFGAAAAHSFVSFWPEGNAGLFSGSQQGSKNMQLVEDIEAEGYAPDHILVTQSLNVQSMRAEWSKLRGVLPNYQGLRNNCSTVVATVLKKGGSGGGLLDRNSAIWTPLKVKRLALAMGAKPIGWSDFLARVTAASGITIAEAAVLQELGKRDERHGSSTMQAYFANGKRVADKQQFSSDGKKGFNFTGGGSAPQAGAQIASLSAFQGGTLFQQGTHVGTIGD